MSADFWAGYISGAIGILVGNPLDLIKTRLQAGSKAVLVSSATLNATQQRQTTTATAGWTSFARGAAAPILGYGALNALLFVTYNRSLALLNGNPHVDILTGKAQPPPAWSIWTAGALGGLATFVVSAPTELVKCRAQVSNPAKSSLQVVREIWGAAGIRGLYFGGGITAVRDAVGYGFYFWSYELSKNAWARDDDTHTTEAVKVLVCGGLAGVVTWASIFPLDVIKTRLQTHDLTNATTTSATIHQPLLAPNVPSSSALSSTSPSQPSASQPLPRPSSFAIARTALRTEGPGVFFRGLGVCSVRAFLVNAVQWAVYEWTIRAFAAQQSQS